MAQRRVATALFAALVGTGILFRLLHLSSIPGVGGDEGWWGVQAMSWLSGRPYHARTTSGNPTDLFFLIPLALVHAVAPPSFLTLRLVPALVNVLALPIACWLSRKLYGNTTAWIHTAAVAVAPTAIAHSRICQDPSQSIFWTGLVVYLSLLAFKDRARARLYCIAALLIFPIALWTHPTNVFIAPFLAPACLAALGPLFPVTRRGRTIAVVATVLGLAAAALIAWPLFAGLEASNDFWNKPWLAAAAARTIDPAQWLEYVVNYARLFSGVTVYHYFSGARPWTVPYDAGSVAIAGAAVAGLWLARRSPLRVLDRALLLAWAGMGLLFYAFAGPISLRPHVERWGLCLIVPGTLVLARGVAGWMESTPRLRAASIAAASTAAAALLVSFHLNYFREFSTTGGRSHATYVTAPVEPKQQALQRILARRDGSRRVGIVAQDWWLFWPIAYLAEGQANVSVTRSLSIEAEPALEDALRNGRLFVVEFVDTPELAAAIDWIHSRGLRSTPMTVQDASGTDLVRILQVTAAH